MPLDPHIKRLLRTLSVAGTVADPGITQRRDAFRGLMRLSEIGSQVGAIEQRDLAGGVTIRLYAPRNADSGRLPALVYFHGGGFICGDLDTHDPFCRTLCEVTESRIVSVLYRQPPEHRFPAALDDALAAAGWVIDHAEEIAVDPTRIGIAGDSAGGTLAAAVCSHVARTRPGVLALQLLLCPILEANADTVSRREMGQGYLVETRGLAEEMAHYLPPGTDPLHPDISPLRQPELRHLPPTVIHTAEFDPLKDEGAAYAERLRQAGVDVRYTCHPGMVHLFYAFGRVVPYARQAHRQIGAEVVERLGAA
ncbi:MAG TPA: alpha/beta hydrolase [Rhodopila sp.]|uniref:alpha/beta hydrolase n=1 Tax=Rhodopila sp. TaxID=2480087 RepID=UPI002B9C0A15|nr:alpha/beta hydrolase [Rhodopila sp.]HVY14541.1 alpha/beta hydrolase [Rhodopila sp.]